MKQSFPRRQRHEGGQATVEAILVLVIVVLITLGILYQFHSAFRSYVNSYFGSYIACLLELGELPGSATCEAEWRAFNLADGRPLVNRIGADGGGSGGSSSRGRDSGSSSGTSEGRQSSSGGGASERSSGDSAQSNDRSRARSGGGETVAGGGGGSSGGGRGLGSRRRSEPVGRVNISGDEAGFSGPEGLSRNPDGQEVGRIKSDSQRQKEIWGVGQASVGESGGRPMVTKTDEKADDDNSLKPKKTEEKIRKISAADTSGEESGFTFGDLLRFLIIIALIIAIVIFFGGQILQISKSWEKN